MAKSNEGSKFYVGAEEDIVPVGPDPPKAKVGFLPARPEYGWLQLAVPLWGIVAMCFWSNETAWRVFSVLPGFIAAVSTVKFLLSLKARREGQVAIEALRVAFTGRFVTVDQAEARRTDGKKWAGLVALVGLMDNDGMAIAAGNSFRQDAEIQFIKDVAYSPLNPPPLSLDDLVAILERQGTEVIANQNIVCPELEGRLFATIRKVFVSGDQLRGSFELYFEKRTWMYEVYFDPNLGFWRIDLSELIQSKPSCYQSPVATSDTPLNG